MQNPELLKNFEPGNVYIFSWFCTQHKCWTLPLPRKQFDNREMSFCPATSAEIDYKDVPGLQRTGHLIELVRQPKFDSLTRPKLENSDEGADDAFFVTASIIKGKIGDREWDVVMRVLMGIE